MTDDEFNEQRAAYRLQWLKDKRAAYAVRLMESGWMGLEAEAAALRCYPARVALAMFPNRRRRRKPTPAGS